MSDRKNLTINQWSGTWVPKGKFPIAFSEDILGAPRTISGEEGDTVLDIDVAFLQEGMLAHDLLRGETYQYLPSRHLELKPGEVSGPLLAEDGTPLLAEDGTPLVGEATPEGFEAGGWLKLNLFGAEGNFLEPITETWAFNPSTVGMPATFSVTGGSIADEGNDQRVTFGPYAQTMINDSYPAYYVDIAATAVPSHTTEAKYVGVSTSLFQYNDFSLMMTDDPTVTIGDVQREILKAASEGTPVSLSAVYVAPAQQTGYAFNIGDIFDGAHTGEPGYASAISVPLLSLNGAGNMVAIGIDTGTGNVYVRLADSAQPTLFMAPAIIAAWENVYFHAGFVSLNQASQSMQSLEGNTASVTTSPTGLPGLPNTLQPLSDFVIEGAEFTQFLGTAKNQAPNGSYIVDMSSPVELSNGINYSAVVTDAINIPDHTFKIKFTLNAGDNTAGIAYLPSSGNFPEIIEASAAGAQMPCDGITIQYRGSYLTYGYLYFIQFVAGDLVTAHGSFVDMGQPMVTGDEITIAYDPATGDFTAAVNGGTPVAMGNYDITQLDAPFFSYFAAGPNSEWSTDDHYIDIAMSGEGLQTKKEIPVELTLPEGAKDGSRYFAGFTYTYNGESFSEGDVVEFYDDTQKIIVYPSNQSIRDAIENAAPPVDEAQVKDLANEAITSSIASPDDFNNGAIDKLITPATLKTYAPKTLFQSLSFNQEFDNKVNIAIEDATYDYAITSDKFNDDNYANRLVNMRSAKSLIRANFADKSEVVPATSADKAVSPMTMNYFLAKKMGELKDGFENPLLMWTPADGFMAADISQLGTTDMNYVNGLCFINLNGVCYVSTDEEHFFLTNGKFGNAPNIFYYDEKYFSYDEDNIYISMNGQDWSSFTLPSGLSNPHWGQHAVGDNGCMIVSGEYEPPYVFYFSSLSDWGVYRLGDVLNTYLSSVGITSASFAQGNFILSFGSYSQYNQYTGYPMGVLTSSDMRTWDRALPTRDADRGGVAYAGSNWYRLTSTNNAHELYVSEDDMLTWTLVDNLNDSLSLNNTESLRSFNGNLFLVDTLNLMNYDFYVSSDGGQSWVNPVYIGGAYWFRMTEHYAFVIGYDSAPSYVSTDGISWDTLVFVDEDDSQLNPDFDVSGTAPAAFITESYDTYNTQSFVHIGSEDRNFILINDNGSWKFKSIQKYAKNANNEYTDFPATMRVCFSRDANRCVIANEYTALISNQNYNLTADNANWSVFVLQQPDSNGLTEPEPSGLMYGTDDDGDHCVFGMAVTNSVNENNKPYAFKIKLENPNQLDSSTYFATGLNWTTPYAGESNTPFVACGSTEYNGYQHLLAADIDGNLYITDTFTDTSSDWRKVVMTDGMPILDTGIGSTMLLSSLHWENGLPVVDDDVGHAPSLSYVTHLNTYQGGHSAMTSFSSKFTHVKGVLPYQSGYLTYTDTDVFYSDDIVDPGTPTQENIPSGIDQVYVADTTIYVAMADNSVATLTFD